MVVFSFQSMRLLIIIIERCHLLDLHRTTHGLFWAWAFWFYISESFSVIKKKTKFESRINIQNVRFKNVFHLPQWVRHATHKWIACFRQYASFAQTFQSNEWPAFDLCRIRNLRYHPEIETIFEIHYRMCSSYYRDQWSGDNMESVRHCFFRKAANVR